MVDEVLSIRCMQLPLVGMQMLLPNAAVAEIIGYDRAAIANATNPPVMGRIPWRGVLVPVVSIEALCQQQVQEPGNRSRIAIVYHPDGDEAIPYLGILLQDIPRAYLAESPRLEGKGEVVECPYLSFRIEEMVDDYYVPDIDAIFEAVRQVN
jgi:chemosensory pili system protein ChpC